MATWLYHQTEPAKVFQENEVEQAMADGWADTPAAFFDEDGKPDTGEREALIAKAKELRIETDGRWGVKRLQKAINDHGA